MHLFLLLGLSYPVFNIISCYYWIYLPSPNLHYQNIQKYISIKISKNLFRNMSHMSLKPFLKFRALTFAAYSTFGGERGGLEYFFDILEEDSNNFIECNPLDWPKNHLNHYIPTYIHIQKYIF